MSRFMSPYDREFEEISKAKDEVYKSTKNYYEKRYISKSKVIAMFTELKSEIDEMQCLYVDFVHYVNEYDVSDLIQEKINSLKENENGNK